MAILILWVIGAAVAGFVASSRGRSGFGFFLLSLLLSPLIGIILAAILSDESNAASTLFLAGPSHEFRARWPDLSRYDPDIAAAVTKLSPYGNEAVLRFRDAYGALNNKDAIPAIVADIEGFARTVKVPSDWAPQGYKRDHSLRGIPIYRSGKSYWVAGEHFGNMKDAQDEARRIAKLRRA